MTMDPPSDVLKIRGVEQSSFDYNQTIHCTIDTQDLNTYWSSTGRDIENSMESLTYELEVPSLVSYVEITAFQALFHESSPIYKASSV